MLNLFHNFVRADKEWPFHFSCWCQCECQYVRRGPLNLSRNETMSYWQVHVKLPAYMYAEIVSPQSIATYPAWLSNAMGIWNYTSYNHLIRRQKMYPSIIAWKYTNCACVMLLGKPNDYARNNACIIAASLAEVPTQNLNLKFEMLQGVNNQANRCLRKSTQTNPLPNCLNNQPACT